MWSCDQYGEVWSLGVSVVNIEGCGPPEVGQQGEEATVCLSRHHTLSNLTIICFFNPHLNIVHFQLPSPNNPLSFPCRHIWGASNVARGRGPAGAASQVSPWHDQDCLLRYPPGGVWPLPLQVEVSGTCTHPHMHTPTHVHTHTQAHTHMHTHTCTHTCTHTTHTCTHPHMYTHTHTHDTSHMHFHMHTPTHAHTHTFTHPHIYTPTHAHTHTCTHPHMHTHTCTHPHMHTPTHVHT